MFTDEKEICKLVQLIVIFDYILLQSMESAKQETKITRRTFLATSIGLVAAASSLANVDPNHTIEIKEPKNKKNMKKIISTKNAPAAIGPYSQAILVNGFLYTSGQIAINPETNELVMDSIQNETHQVMKNLKAILTEAGMEFSDVVKTGIFLQNMNDFQAVNEVYASYFSSDFPARETVEVAKLPKGVNVEISMIGVKG
jgi:2-iminobutanoate/2-iminopropanoate deaminase